MIIYQEKCVRFQLKELAIFCLVLPQCRFCTLAFRDIDKYGLAKRALFCASRQNRIHANPFFFTLFSQQPKLARTCCARSEKLPNMRIIAILIFRHNKTAQLLPEQSLPFYSQQFCYRKIGLHNHPFCGNRQISHRSNIIKIEIACLRRFHSGMRSLQFFIQHCQLSLLQNHFPKHAASRLRRKDVLMLCRAGFISLCRLFPHFEPPGYFQRSIYLCGFLLYYIEFLSKSLTPAPVSLSFEFGYPVSPFIFSPV